MVVRHPNIDETYLKGVFLNIWYHTKLLLEALLHKMAPWVIYVRTVRPIPFTCSKRMYHLELYFTQEVCSFIKFIFWLSSTTGHIPNVCDWSVEHCYKILIPCGEHAPHAYIFLKEARTVCKATVIWLLTCLQAGPCQPVDCEHKVLWCTGSGQEACHL